MKYFIIGDEDAVLGFGMVGVLGRIVYTAEQTRAAFEETLLDKDVGIIIMTERVADFIRSTIDKFIFTQDFPLIVEIPDRTGPIPGKPGIREMVNTAIGIKL